MVHDAGFCIDALRMFDELVDIFFMESNPQTFKYLSEPSLCRAVEYFEKGGVYGMRVDTTKDLPRSALAGMHITSCAMDIGYQRLPPLSLSKVEV